MQLTNLLQVNVLQNIFPTTFHLHARLSLGDSKLANPVDALLEAVYASRMPKITFIHLTTDVLNETVTIQYIEN